ncbi:unnamed protein product [Cylindrotheca closterium]|uniref:Uncharacterized protein n=1 Tax=Cylindrotheca closterium TaxID=2856 RepID=A0AAD2FQJ9_9STRA|nr:unnamed protein product [Cylindrotheca closterium]
MKKRTIDAVNEDAAQSLVRFNNKRQKSAYCPLCSDVFYIGTASYDFCVPISSANVENRKLVRAGRQHCKKKHPTSFLWNLLPRRDKLLANIPSRELTLDVGLGSDNDIFEVDALFVVAMSKAAKLHPVGGDSSIHLIRIGMLCRLSMAKAWLKWMTSRRCSLSSKLGKDKAREVIKKTSDRLEELILALSDIRPVSHLPQGATEVFNEFNLFALIPGRHRQTWLVDGLTGQL